VGFDSNETLGEKETGAKAALPIWMTLMKAAIAGKDDEHFLMDEKESPALKAGVGLPGKAAGPSGSGAGIQPAKGAVAVKTPGAAAPSVPAAKPALPMDTVPVKATGKVKPALPEAPNR